MSHREWIPTSCDGTIWRLKGANWSVVWRPFGCLPRGSDGHFTRTRFDTLQDAARWCLGGPYWSVWEAGTACSKVLDRNSVP